MSGPWEKYAAQTEATGPWAKYQGGAQKKEETSLADDIKQGIGNIAAGAVRGAGSIGATILAPIDAAARSVGIENSFIGRKDRRQAMDEGLASLGAETDSFGYGLGKIGAEIAGTAGAGGAVANLLGRALPASVASAPTVSRLLQAVETSGFRTGAPAATSLKGKAINMLMRSGGGGVSGAASAALVNPEDADIGAVAGAVLPPAIAGLGAAGRYSAGAVRSLVAPYTAAGVDEIAGKVIRKFAEGGPTSIDARQLVQNSAPTLAEATGNAGLATLQRGVRDIRPNAFVEREALNAAARSGLFDDVAGNPEAVSAAKAARDQAAKALYGRAFEADAMRQSLAKEAAETRAPFGAVGLNGARDDLATPGLRALTQRPMFAKAIEEAKVLAANNGQRLDDPLQSLDGLHYVKLALDDMLNPGAKSAMGRNASGAVESMRDELANELAKISPLYGNARQTYAEMSRPVNAMEALQGLKLTDAQGNITLAKVQNAIRALEQRRAAPGVDAAKAVTDDQMTALFAIRDDLLRQANLGLGRSIGSNTFQNLATDNILQSSLGSGLTRLADKYGVSGAVGQVGRLAYSGPNEAIRNRLVDMMLMPELAQQAMLPPAAAQPNALARLLGDPRIQQPLHRVAGPLIASDR